MKKLILVITLCILISCSLKGSKNDNSQTRGFLELTLASTKNETRSQINSLINSGRIQKLKSKDLKGYFGYSFYINGKEYNSFFVLSFNDKDELLESITIEIQDPSNQIHIEDIHKLLAKKYGNPNDSSTSFYHLNLKDPFKSYTWNFNEKSSVEISAERTYLSSFGNTSDNTNFFKIKYEDMDLFFDDWRERMMNENKKNNEVQNKTENDL